MADISAFEADGLRFKVPVVADPMGSTPVPDISGGTAVVHARSGETVVAGTATCTGAAEVTVAFAAMSLAPGEWEVQVGASATVAPYRTVWSGVATILDSIRSA